MPFRNRIREGFRTFVDEQRNKLDNHSNDGYVLFEDPDELKADLERAERLHQATKELKTVHGEIVVANLVDLGLLHLPGAPPTFTSKYGEEKGDPESLSLIDNAVKHAY